MLTFSIVINTLNRANLLDKTLNSFRWLKYEGAFEVIVVNGPSIDHTQEVIDSWLPRIRTARCDIANLSKSRNIGICMARGDIVAFIDDDAIPEPEWLTHLEEAYNNPTVGGAGGRVFDQSGYTYQYEYSTANRLGDSNWTASASAEHLCFPSSFEFPYLQGTNASFRRDALLEIGGFDEEIEYYLDETEVCCRLVDAGFIIRQIPSAYVHHKFAPSNVRDEHKVVRYRYPVLKNKIYFALKHGRNYATLDEIEASNKAFTDFHRKDVEFHISGGRLDQKELETFAQESSRAWSDGVSRGLSESRELITVEKTEIIKGDFLQFDALESRNLSATVLISRDFPPDHSGGVGTFTKDLAEALAAGGDIVHVVTESPDINRVDFENGVWVHRMIIIESALPKIAGEHSIPPSIWNWSNTAFCEVKRISEHRKIRLVEAPIWDCEGVAFLLARQWPLVTSLQTTLHFFLESHPEIAKDQAWMDSFGKSMMALEKIIMRGSDSVRSISRAIKQNIEEAYDFKFDEEKLVISPLGMPPASASHLTQQSGDDLIILYVGRLEYRKGIDTLLKAIPIILAEQPSARFRILGDDTLATDSGKGTYKSNFVSSSISSELKERVQFEGRVSNEVLANAYRSCDIFVAPSRFESFGLVFLEAMREGKPVIGCESGGIPEIVLDDVNGVLVPPGDVDQLVSAILRLLGSESDRHAMGKRGLNRFLSTFTSGQMAEESLPLYRMAVQNFSQASP